MSLSINILIYDIAMVLLGKILLWENKKPFVSCNQKCNQLYLQSNISLSRYFEAYNSIFIPFCMLAKKSFIFFC